MKITPIKIAKTALILTTLSIASCGTAKYGCDYGAVRPTKINKFKIEESKILSIEEIATTYCYVKSTDI